MKKEYALTVGLEVHAELATQTKMFCSSKNDPDEKRPNTNVCPVCLGYPGTLPVINKEAVRSVLRFGVAVGGELADYTEFDRKNYFYPDIPKGYQISQYKYPLVKGGQIRGIALTRVHLEEDTATSKHASDGSLIDFNRAGVPLMELVTEPVIHSPEEAGAFARELQMLLVYLGISHANMEKGEMRVEANISVSDTPGVFGTKVEVKNLNSFKAVEKAIQFEMNRHSEMLERGEKIIQETRGWDESKEETFSQRAKEDSHDYRYFPDPDLPKLFISEIPDFSREALLATLPELPWQKRERLEGEYGLKSDDVDTLVRDSEWAGFFEQAARGESQGLAKLVANYLLSDVRNLAVESGKMLGDLSLDPAALRDLMKMVEVGELSSRGAKDVLKVLVTEGGDPRTVAESKDLFQKSDAGELKKIAEHIVAENSAAVTEYKAGKSASLQFLVGQGMKATKGSANPQLLKQIFEEIMK